MECRQVVHAFNPPDPSALAPLAKLRPDLVLAFGSLEVMERPGFFDHLKEAFPGSVLAGCSTAGEISSRGVTEKSCVITAIRFTGPAPVRVGETRIARMEDCQAAGAALGAALRGPDLRTVLMFGKGVEVNGSAIIAGLAGEIGPGIPISGGLAGDDGAFLTLTLGPSGLSADGVVAVGLCGEDRVVAHGSRGGWAPFGPARRVTRSLGNILYELDGEPALNIYKRYLGEHSAGLPASGLLFPFEMLDGERSQVGLIRTILGVDEASGSLVLAGDIDPEGYLRLMHASGNALVDGAEAAARQALGGACSTGRSLALLVSCVGRRLVLGDAVDEEVEAVAAILPPGTLLAGFYSYGEIAPSDPAGDCRLHNQTMTITLLGG